MTGSLIYDNVKHGVTFEVEVANIYRSGRVIDSHLALCSFPRDGTCQLPRESTQLSDSLLSREESPAR